MDGTPKAALCPESFGYGPASKALAVARNTRAVNFLGLCEGTAHDFLAHNGIHMLERCGPGGGFDELRKAGIEISLAAAFLDARWVKVMIDKVPTVFIDSLAFIWDPDFLVRNPHLKRCTYIVQDVLGSAEAAQRIGIPEPVLVEPIVDIASARAPDHPVSIVVSLGGVVVHGQVTESVAYIEAVSSILQSLPELDSVLVLGGKSALKLAAPAGSIQGRAARSATHQEAIGYYQSAEVVYGSPGLTTLLELAATNTRFIPLPPQNYSQCIITRKAASIGRLGGDNSHPAWHILGNYFNPPLDLKESDGVDWARERLRKFMKSGRPVADYVNSLKLWHDARRPDLQIMGFDGARQIGLLIERLIQ